MNSRPSAMVPRAWLGVVLVFALLLPAVTAASADAPWLKLQAGDFVLFSNAPEKDVTDLAAQYAAYRQIFRTLFVPPNRTMPASVLLAYRRSSELGEALAGAGKPKGGTATHCSSEVDGTPVLVFALTGNREQTLASTFEFETVWAIDHVGYSVPIWMSQGAGEVLSTLQFRDGRCLVGYTGRDLDLKNFNSTQIPWPHFFEIGESSPEYHGRRATGDFHVQAWGLMHWVLFGGEARERFSSLAERLHSTAGLAAVEAVTGTPSAEFRSAIFHHLGQFKAREFPVDLAALRASFKIAPAPEAEVLAHLADALAGTDNVAGGDRQLDRARSLAPNHPAVLAALARRALREEHADDAIQFYRQALAAGASSPALYLKSADAYLAESFSAGNESPGCAGLNAFKAIDDVRHALALDPGNAAAYVLLGRAYFVAPSLTPDKADELTPGLATGEEGEQVRFYRAMLYARTGKFDACLADLRDVIADPATPDRLRDRAREQFAGALVDGAAAKIEQFIQDGNFDEARKLYAGIADNELTPDSRRKRDALKKHLDESTQ